MSHRTHHGPLAPLHTERVFPEPAFWAVYTLFAFLVLIALGGCASTHTQPPPYGILTYEHSHYETVDPATDKVTARNCHTRVEGGVETTGAALQGQSCGDTLGGTSGSISAFPGQAIGAPLFAAKIQADAARDQTLLAGGFQLGQLATCAGMLAATPATAGAALPAAAAACLQAIKGIVPTPTPTPAPSPVVPPVIVRPPPVTPPVPAPLPPFPHASALPMLESPEP